MSRVNPYYTSAHWRTLRKAALERDGYRCVVPGCTARAVIVDHIRARGDSPHPCELDRLDNLRSLCTSHDAQVRQRPREQGYGRRNDGSFRVKGCDSEGRSLDPSHPWNR